MVAVVEPAPSIAEKQGRSLLFGLINLIVAFAIVCGLWYVFLHPNGIMALYTPMYGFSLIVTFAAVIVLISKVADCYPFDKVPASPLARGIVLTVFALVLMWVLVYGFFWGFIGRFGITYFSPYSIVRAGGIGAEIFNARENASTAIVYLFTAFLWIALLWSVGFVKWPWKGLNTGALALARLGVVGLLSTIAYVVLFHPHVCYLFYPAQTMAGVEPWWSSYALTSSAYFNLGILLCTVLWIVVSDVLWEGYPWRRVDREGEGSFARGVFAFVGTFVLGVVTFLVMLQVMNIFWFEPFEGGQYTDAPYFRYLHSGEVAGFVILSVFIIKVYFNNGVNTQNLWLRAFARTLIAAAGGALFYVFYYSQAATILLGKVPGIGQPEDTPLVWTLLFISVVLIQGEFFKGWPLPRREPV